MASRFTAIERVFLPPALPSWPTSPENRVNLRLVDRLCYPIFDSGHRFEEAFSVHFAVCSFIFLLSKNETMKEDRRDGSKRSTRVEIALTIAGSVIDNILRIVNCLSKRRWMDRKNDRVKKIRYELCTLCLNKNVSHICPIIFTLSTGRITRVTCNFWK